MRFHPRLAEILGRNRGKVILIALSILAGAGLELVPPLVMQQAIDAHLEPRILEGLWGLAALYLGAVLCVQGTNALTAVFTNQVAQDVLYRLRTKLFAHIQKLPMQYFESNPLGDIISRCTTDVDTIETLFSTGSSALLADLTRLVIIFIAMLSLSPSLSLLLIGVLPPIIWITNLFRKHIRRAEQQTRVAFGKINTHLQETLGGVEVIRAYGREPAFVARFRRLLGHSLISYNRSAQYSAVYSPLMQTLMATVIALILYTGARNAFSSLHISLGTLTAFVLLFKRFFDPIMSIGEEWQTVQSALSGLERIFEVMDTPCEPDCTTPQPTNKKHSTGIEFNHVTFGYSPKRAVLQDISFQVAEGEHVALIGRTGAGKSSILNLVSGLYAPWDGNIRVAGYDPRQLIEGQRRKVIGVVPQKIQLFSGTILENLTLGDTSIPVDVVQKAAQLTGADGFICSFKQGYETQIGGNRGQGVRLSVGQRQLLSLTRALVWDPPILLFDEATSAIDSASEAAFRESLRNQAARQGHTILTVAHRLATAREADRLIVLGQGRILEVGTPRELERLKGAYAALLALEQGDAPKVSREGLAKAA